MTTDCEPAIQCFCYRPYHRSPKVNFYDMLDFLLQYCSCEVGKTSSQKLEETLVCFNTVVVLFSIREFVYQ